MNVMYRERERELNETKLNSQSKVIERPKQTLLNKKKKRFETNLTIN